MGQNLREDTRAERVRTFIAIELPEQVKALLARLQERLRRTGNDAVKWVDPQGIHLTLRFLGEIPASHLPDIERALMQAAQRSEPFWLETDGVGAFPSIGRPRVIWVAVQGDVAALQRLKMAVDEALRPLRFPPEDRPFSPHLTLGRVRPSASPQEIRGLAALLRSTSWEERATFEAHAVSLMRSDLAPRGAIYTPLAVFRLGS